MVPSINPVLAYSIFAWSLVWEGLALWFSARNNQRNWFIAFLIIHTLGILEIIYLFKFAKKPLKVKDLQFWKKK